MGAWVPGLGPLRRRAVSAWVPLRRRPAIAYLALDFVLVRDFVLGVVVVCWLVTVGGGSAARSVVDAGRVLLQMHGTPEQLALTHQDPAFDTGEFRECESNIACIRSRGL